MQIYYFPFFATMNFIRYAGLTPISFFEFVVFIGISISYIFLTIGGFSKHDHYIFLFLGVFELVVWLFLLLNILSYKMVHPDIHIVLGIPLYLILIHSIIGIVYGSPIKRKKKMSDVTKNTAVGNANFEGKKMGPIGDFLREKREQGGYTQQKLADEIPVSRQTIHRWESGKSHPDMEYMIRVAEILNFPVTEFWGNDNEKVNSEIGNVVKKRNAYRQAVYFLLTLILVSLSISVVAVAGRNLQSPVLDMMNPFIKESTGYTMVSKKGKQKAIVVDNDVGDGNIITLNGYSKKTEFVKVVHKGSYVKAEVRNISTNKVPDRVRYNLFYASHFNNLNDGLKKMQTTYEKREI